MAFITLRTWLHQLSRHRAISVTTEGVRFLLLTLAVGIAAVNTGNNLFYLLLAMMLSLIVLSGFLSEQCVRRLEFHRHLPDTLFVNQPATATLWLPTARPIFRASPCGSMMSPPARIMSAVCI